MGTPPEDWSELETVEMRQALIPVELGFDRKACVTLEQVLWGLKQAAQAILEPPFPGYFSQHLEKLGLAQLERNDVSLKQKILNFYQTLTGAITISSTGLSMCVDDAAFYTFLNVLHQYLGALKEHGITIEPPGNDPFLHNFYCLLLGKNEMYWFLTAREAQHISTLFKLTGEKNLGEILGAFLEVSQDSMAATAHVLSAGFVESGLLFTVEYHSESCEVMGGGASDSVTERRSDPNVSLDPMTLKAMGVGESNSVAEAQSDADVSLDPMTLEAMGAGEGDSVTEDQSGADVPEPMTLEAMGVGESDNASQSQGGVAGSREPTTPEAMGAGGRDGVAKSERDSAESLPVKPVVSSRETKDVVTQDLEGSAGDAEPGSDDEGKQLDDSLWSSSTLATPEGTPDVSPTLSPEGAPEESLAPVPNSEKTSNGTGSDIFADPNASSSPGEPPCPPIPATSSSVASPIRRASLPGAQPQSHPKVEHVGRGFWGYLGSVGGQISGAFSMLYHMAGRALRMLAFWR